MVEYSGDIRIEVSVDFLAQQIKIFKFTMSDAYDYWQNKLGSSSNTKGTDKKNKSKIEREGQLPNDANRDDIPSDEEIDEDFSNDDFEDSEVKFSEDDDPNNEDPSMAKDDDFQISSSIPAAGSANLVAAKMSSQKKRRSTEKGNETVKPTPAQERLQKILEEEKREERQAKLKAIKEAEMAKIRATISESQESNQSSSRPFGTESGAKILNKKAQNGQNKQNLAESGSSDAEVEFEEDEVVASADQTVPFGEQSLPVGSGLVQAPSANTKVDKQAIPSQRQEGAAKFNSSPDPVSVFKIQEGAQKGENTAQNPRKEDSEEEISEDDFVEEEIDDEIVESGAIDNDTVTSPQVFSVHDAKSKKTEDSVGNLPSPKQGQIPGGNSTVNMGSVVPQAVPNPKSFLDSKSMTQNNQKSSSAHLGQNNQKRAGSLLRDAQSFKPIKPQHKLSPDQKQTSSKASKIEDQMKQIRPRYGDESGSRSPPQRKAPVTAGGRAVRPMSALPPTQNKVRVKSNNRDLSREGVTMKSNQQNGQNGQNGGKHEPQKKASWGAGASNNNAPKKPKYELPDSAKPKARPKTGKLPPVPSTMKIEKDIPYVKPKNPGVPGHRIVIKDGVPRPAARNDSTSGGGAMVRDTSKNRGQMDLSASASNKLKMMRKLKEQKTKDVVVKQLSKSGVPTTQQKAMRASVEKAEFVGAKKPAQFRMPAKNAAFPSEKSDKNSRANSRKRASSKPSKKVQNKPNDENKDLNDMFEDFDVMAGDQGAPPGQVDDEFGEEIMAGDQAAGFDDMPDEEGDFDMDGGDDYYDEEEPKSEKKVEQPKKTSKPVVAPKKQVTKNADFSDAEADEDANNFLNDISQPAKKQSVRELAESKKQLSQKSKQESNWQGNGVGSGKLQQQTKDDQKQLERKNINIGLQASKKPPKVDEKNAKKAWGFNPTGKTKVEINEENAKLQRDNAKQKFEELQAEKKAKAENGNQDIDRFMALMSKQDKDKKKAEKIDAINPLAKQEVKTKAPLGAPASEKVPLEASQVNDKIGTEKQLVDLQKQLKQLFFENKQTQRHVMGIEKQRTSSMIQLENYLTKNNLQRVHGKIQPQTQEEDPLDRELRLNQIPSYEKLAARANPLEAVVKKFEERGYKPSQAFTIFDDDEDEVLTIQEIKNGMKLMNIDLLDSEWKLLLDSMDENADGVLTLDEWEQTLKPRLNAQREFIKIMKDLNINDPLVMEEQILDLTFRKRALALEVKVASRSKNQEQFFRKKQVKNEQKALTDKIKELEKMVHDSRHREQEDAANLDEKLKSNKQTKAEVEAEYELLQKTKRELEIEYSFLQEKHKKDMFAQDQLYNDVSRYSVDIKQDRDRKKLQLSKMKVKLAKELEMEKKIDKELEAILGRAVTMEDVEALYAQDLKLLNAIECGLGNKIQSMKEILAAIHLQRAWKGFVARKRVARERAKLGEFTEKYNVFVNKIVGHRRERAAKVLQRAWRRYWKAAQERRAANRRRFTELEKKKTDVKEPLKEVELEKLEKAALTIQRNWRAYKKRKTYKQDKARYHGEDFFGEIYDIKKVKKVQEKRANELLIDAAHEGISEKKETVQCAIYNYWDKKTCTLCKKNASTRICITCGHDQMMCTACFAKKDHTVKHKGKRLYFHLVVCDKKLPEGIQMEEDGTYDRHYTPPKGCFARAFSCGDSKKKKVEKSKSPVKKHHLLIEKEKKLEAEKAALAQQEKKGGCFGSLMKKKTPTSAQKQAQQKNSQTPQKLVNPSGVISQKSLQAQKQNSTSQSQASQLLQQKNIQAAQNKPGQTMTSDSLQRESQSPATQKKQQPISNSSSLNDRASDSMKSSLKKPNPLSNSNKMSLNSTGISQQVASEVAAIPNPPERDIQLPAAANQTQLKTKKSVNFAKQVAA